MSTPTPEDGAPEVAALQPSRPDVFISYSRQNDRPFVMDELVPALTEREKAVWVDLRSVPPAADWRERVRRGIASTKAFVFVLSPDSVVSKECAVELQHALTFKKRLIPVLRRDVQASDAPEELERRNWIMLRNRAELADHLPTLIDALETDLGWREAHAFYTERAQDWLEGEGNLLSGSALRSAEDWLSQQGEHREQATRQQREFIQQSRRVAGRRRRILWGSVLVALAVTATLAVVAWIQRREAIRQADIAVARQLVANAELTREESPRLLERSVLLGVEAMRRAPFPSADTERPLRLALALLPRRLHSFRFDGRVADVAASRDGLTLAVGTRGGTVAVHELPSGRELRRWSRPSPVRAVAISPDGERVAEVRRNGSGSIRSVSDSQSVLPLRGVGPVSDMEFSPEKGRFLATGGEDRTARLWSARTGNRAIALRHRYPVNALAFSPNGRRLATGTGPDPYEPPFLPAGRAAVWSVPAGERLAVVRHVQIVNDVAFGPPSFLHPGPARLITASDDGTARQWDLRRGTSSAVVHHSGEVVEVAVSADGDRVATASMDGTARVWDSFEEPEVAVLSHGDQPVTAVALSRDGRHVATGSWDRTARVWEADGGREVARTVYGGDVASVAFARADRSIVTAVGDTVRAWDARGFGWTGRVVGWEAFSPGGRYAAAGADDMAAEQVWDMLRSRDAARIPADGLFAIGRPVAFAADDGLIALAQRRNEIGVWPLPQGAAVATLPQPGALKAKALALDRSGAHLAVAHRRVVSVWDVHGQEVLRSLPHERKVLEIALSPDGRTVLSVAGDWRAEIHGNVVRVVASKGSAPARNLRHHGPAGRLRFSPDGAYFATSDERGAHLWRTQTRSEVEFRPKESIHAFSPDGGRVATVTEAGTIRVREVPGMDEVSRMRHGPLAEVDFSPDGEHLTSAAGETARVWEVATGREVARIPKDTDGARGVSFSSDGRYVVVAERDPHQGYNAAARWAWRPGDLIAEACARLSRNLERDEWQQYLPVDEYRATCPNLQRAD